MRPALNQGQGDGLCHQESWSLPGPSSGWFCYPRPWPGPKSPGSVPGDAAAAAQSPGQTVGLGRWGQPQEDPGQHEQRLALTSQAVTTDEFQNAGAWQSLTSCTETAQF